jgi:hypothetical protein
MSGIIIALLIVILIVLIMIWLKISPPDSKPPSKTAIKFYEIKTKKVSSDYESDAEPKGVPIDLTKLKRKSSNRPRKSQIQSNLEAYLVSLVNGDKNIAIRLIANAEKNNPSEDRAWCVQKAIDEILRDRN